MHYIGTLTVRRYCAFYLPYNIFVYIVQQKLKDHTVIYISLVKRFATFRELSVVAFIKKYKC